MSGRKCVSCKKANFDKDDTKTRTEKMCRKCFDRHPRRTCVHCDKHFSAFTPVMIASGRCRKCADDFELSGPPKACLWCRGDAAFGDETLCRHCAKNKKSYGEPVACEGCSNTAAFRKADTSKVGGKLLCYRCTFKYKQSKAKGGAFGESPASTPTAAAAASTSSSSSGSSKRKSGESGAAVASAAAAAVAAANKRYKSDSPPAASPSDSTAASAATGAASNLATDSAASASSTVRFAASAAGAASGSSATAAATDPSGGDGDAGSIAYASICSSYERLVDEFEQFRSHTESRIAGQTEKFLAVRAELNQFKAQNSELNRELLEVRTANGALKHKLEEISLRKAS